MQFAPTVNAYRGFWLLLPLGLCLMDPGQSADVVEITQCGQVITTDAVLIGDLVCDTGEFESIAVKIDASNITLDLGGYVISGHPIGIGISAIGVEGVTIKNGVIESFLSGMDIGDSRNVLVENLTIRNLVDGDPNNFTPGLRVNRSQEIRIKDSFFEFVPVAHKEAIVTADSQVTVDHIETRGGGVGVNISGDSSLGNMGSTVTVLNSDFFEVTIAGVLVQFTEEARIANNRFIDCGGGVTVDLHNKLSPNGISGITIEGNIMHGGGIGVHFQGVTDSSILNNDIRNTWRGIFLDANMGCPGIPDCVYSSGNSVIGNTVVSNFIDLYHYEDALGNTWQDNKCQKKEGVEIPECTILFLDSFEFGTNNE